MVRHGASDATPVRTPQPRLNNYDLDGEPRIVRAGAAFSDMGTSGFLSGPNRGDL
jgi:hypothetical protein